MVPEPTNLSLPATSSTGVYGGATDSTMGRGSAGEVLGAPVCDSCAVPVVASIRRTTMDRKLWVGARTRSVLKCMADLLVQVLRRRNCIHFSTAHVVTDLRRGQWPVGLLRILGWWSRVGM